MPAYWGPTLGAYAGWIVWRAFDQLHWSRAAAELLALFEGTITPEMLQQIKAWLPGPNADAYRPEQFVNRQYPFDAYTVQVESLTH